jgi:hypothetical protein
LFKVHAARGNGASFISPDAKVSVRVGAVGIVDDTTEAINDFANDSATPSLMVDKATKDAQRWNDLLAITGGALEIPKCRFHLASYKFAASGAPVLDPLMNAINGMCPKMHIQPAFSELQKVNPWNIFSQAWLDAHSAAINALREIQKQDYKPSGRMLSKRVR